MSVQTAIWNAPSYCGCQIQMTGDWPAGQVINGDAANHHPLSNLRRPDISPITNLKIINVCADHQQYTLSMPDTSQFFDVADPNSYQGMLAAQYPDKPAQPIQNRGYLKYPIANPTPAECLYTFLSMYSGFKTSPLPCGCQAHAWGDETNFNGRQGNYPTIVHSPRHTNHCHHHKNDTPDLQKATSDAILILKKMVAAQPDNTSIAEQLQTLIDQTTTPSVG